MKATDTNRRDFLKRCLGSLAAMPLIERGIVATAIPTLPVTVPPEWVTLAHNLGMMGKYLYCSIDRQVLRVETSDEVCWDWGETVSLRTFGRETLALMEWDNESSTTLVNVSVGKLPKG